MWNRTNGQGDVIAKAMPFPKHDSRMPNPDMSAEERKRIWDHFDDRLSRVLRGVPSPGFDEALHAVKCIYECDAQRDRETLTNAADRDWCAECKHRYTEENRMPCCNCKHCYIDMFAPLDEGEKHGG
jgi:hypothetical protein